MAVTDPRIHYPHDRAKIKSLRFAATGRGGAGAAVFRGYLVDQHGNQTPGTVIRQPSYARPWLIVFNAPAAGVYTLVVDADAGRDQADGLRITGHFAVGVDFPDQTGTDPAYCGQDLLAYGSFNNGPFGTAVMASLTSANSYDAGNPNIGTIYSDNNGFWCAQWYNLPDDLYSLNVSDQSPMAPYQPLSVSADVC